MEFIEEGDKEKRKEDKTAGKEGEGEHDGMTIFILINFNNLHLFVRDTAVFH